jgi:hypothetical protein
MSSVLYQTFYPYNKFDDIQTIPNLNKWMLSKDVLRTITMAQNTVKPTTTSSLNEPMPAIIPTPSAPGKPPQCISAHFIVPDKMDTLFWCMYISHYGEQQYLAIGNKYGNAEIAEKQKIVEFLKSNKNVLKNINRKITIGLYQEIMSDLMTNAKTSLLSLVAFSVYYKKNILLLNTTNKTFLEYRYDDHSINTSTGSVGGIGELGPWLVIKYTENKKYGFFTEDISGISGIIREYIYIASPDKPLKGISTYKIGELVEIAAKIPELANIPGSESVEHSLKKMAKEPKEPKMSKPDLYGKIWHNLLWT